jgi:hypothetical protein
MSIIKYGAGLSPAQQTMVKAQHALPDLVFTVDLDSTVYRERKGLEDLFRGLSGISVKNQLHLPVR